MSSYSFTLLFALPEGLAECDDLDERLGEAGLLDATVGLGASGRVALAVGREASSAEIAIASVIQEVKVALPGSELVEAGPDCVGLSDAAALFGMSRQAMRKHWMQDPSFPLPMHQGHASLWHWVDLVDWAHDKWPGRLDDEVRAVALIVRRMNLEISAARAGFSLVA